MILELPVTSITIDARCQPRMTMNPEVIDDYAAAMGGGARLPPLIVFRDNTIYWLADGFHRFAAARQAHLPIVTCDVFDGDQRDAILYSAGANADHGLRRSNLDKRKAVETLLNDPEWSQWSNVEIARRCAVSHTFVNGIRASLETVSSDNKTQTVKYEDRWGNAREMKTGNIGKPKPATAKPATRPAKPFDDGDSALPPAVPWDERDSRAATAMLECGAVVAQHDARRVAYAVAAEGGDSRQRVMAEAIELRVWLAELVHHLQELGA